MMGYDERTWGVGQWLAVSATSLLLLGFLIALAVWLASGRHGGQPLRGSNRGNGPHAQDLLAERYARGEIDEEDFMRRREQLRGTGRSAAEQADDARTPPAYPPAGSVANAAASRTPSSPLPASASRAVDEVTT